MPTNEKPKGRFKWNIPERDIAAMGRRQRYQARRLNEGLCVLCGNEPLGREGARLGLECLIKQRERMAKKTNAKRTYPNAVTRMLEKKKSSTSGNGGD